MKKNRQGAFTLVEIMIVVALIGLLAAIAIPNTLHAHASSQQSACIDNIRRIDSAKQQWAMEYRISSSVTPAETDIGPYLNRGRSTIDMTCPADPGRGKKQKRSFDSSYHMNAVTNPPTCRIFPNSHVLD